jgi:hypothetical protein
MEDHVDAIGRQWARERPDLDVSALLLLGRLFRVAHLADAELGARIRRHDLEPGWFDLLAALRRNGAPFELGTVRRSSSTRRSSCARPCSPPAA